MVVVHQRFSDGVADADGAPGCIPYEIEFPIGVNLLPIGVTHCRLTFSDGPERCDAALGTEA